MCVSVRDTNNIYIYMYDVIYLYTSDNVCVYVQIATVFFTWDIHGMLPRDDPAAPTPCCLGEKPGFSRSKETIYSLVWYDGKNPSKGNKKNLHSSDAPLGSHNGFAMLANPNWKKQEREVSTSSRTEHAPSIRKKNCARRVNGCNKHQRRKGVETGWPQKDLLNLHRSIMI